jgi:hypothetical protein
VVRLILSRALLEEDQDLAAAERALRAVLALCPDHAEARHNLAVLMGRVGKRSCISTQLAIEKKSKKSTNWTPSRLRHCGRIASR